jgi:hypothetical protein
MRAIKAGVITGLLFMGLACSNTQVTSKWKNPSAVTTPPNRVLVVALVPQETTRRTLEDKLVAGIVKDGPMAVPSYHFFPDGRAITREMVKDLVVRNRFDSILVTQYRGTEHETQYVPGSYGDYFGYAVPMVYAPGYIETIDRVKLESRLFETKGGGQLVWSATTATTDSASTEGTITDAANKIAEQLDKDVHI